MNPEDLKTKLNESLERLKMQMQNEQSMGQRAQQQLNQHAANVNAIEGAMQENRRMFDEMFPVEQKKPELSIVKPEVEGKK
jgi:hypothetical protein